MGEFGLFEQFHGNSKKKNKTLNKRWAIVSIASIPLVMTLGNSMLIPVLPSMEREFNITSLQSSLIITVYSIVAIIFIPLAGYLSDKWGRKVIIIPSLILTAIGGLLSALAIWKMKDPYGLILIGRALQGIGAAGAFPIVLPLVGDMFHRDDEISSTLGVIETSNTLGKVLSPILGAFLASFFISLPFFSIPVFSTISLLMMVFLVKCPKVKDAPPLSEFFNGIKITFRHNHQWLIAVFIIGGILMFVLFGVLFYLSNILETIYKIGDIKKGFMLAIPLGALCLSSYITGKKIKEDKTLMKRIIFFGLVMLAIAVFFLSFTKNLWLSISLFVFVGIGIGIGLPCLDALITQGIEKEKRGTITSLYSSMRFIGVALGPPILAILLKSLDQYIFYILTGICILTALVCIVWIRPEKEEEDSFLEKF
ncbi:MFS transporter [Bacillus kwashiorkori]|uniref:MFS transporter n=1 Tax=Bacillus kwashiorkori TaxID=1522318 RepID=UPI000A40EC25|nr:MFS transporter [Bacillus kwashiorkori]